MRHAKCLPAAGLSAALLASQALASTNPPRIDDIQWYNADAHCAFSRSGHKLKKNDPKSWRFVFLIGRTDGDSKATIETAYMKIGGILRELRFQDRVIGEGAEIRHYTTYGDDPVRVEVEMKARKGGAKPTGYTGTLRAIRDQTEARLEFTGNCGR